MASSKINVENISYLISSEYSQQAPFIPALVILLLSSNLFINVHGQDKYSPWYTSHWTEHRKQSDYFAGYDEVNNTIYLIRQDPTFRLVGLHLNESNDNDIQSVQYYDTTWLPTQYCCIVSHSFSSTQLNNVIYYINDYGSLTNIDRLHLLPLLSIEENYTAIPSRIGQRSSLVAITLDHDYLFVIGGQYTGAWNRTQVFDVTANTWKYSQGPQLNTGRASASVVAMDQKIYIIGGTVTDSWLSAIASIETLDVSDIVNLNAYSWQYTSYSLSESRHSFAVITYGTDILCIGGGGTSDRYLFIEVIDTISERTYVDASLSFATGFTPEILVYPYMWVTDKWDDKLQYHKLELSIQITMFSSEKQ